MSTKKIRNTNSKFILQNSIKKSTFNCDTLSGLHNSGSSCYLDSVLFCLFAIPNQFINDNILFCNISKTTHKDSEFIKQVQKILIEITKSIRITKNIKFCTKFSNLIEKFPLKGMPNFGKLGQQEAGEFLIYLLTIFNVNCKSRKKNENFATNNINQFRKKELIKTSTTFDKEGSILMFIDSFQLLEKSKKANLLYYFTKTIRDTGELSNENRLCIIKHGIKSYFKRQITYSSLIDTPYLIFWLQRANPIDNSVIKTEIVPTQKMTLESGRVLYLNAIILHIGTINSGHYISYFRYNDKWYTYDDIGAEINIIGNYFKMLQQTPSVKTNGVLYFYCEK